MGAFFFVNELFIVKRVIGAQWMMEMMVLFAEENGRAETERGFVVGVAFQ